MYKSLLMFVSLLIYVNCAKILAVFPIASISHQVVFRPLTQELARRGHDVVVITTDPVFPEGLKNFKEIDLHNVSYKYIREEVIAKLDLGNVKSRYSLAESIFTSCPKIVEMQIELPEVQNVIRNTKYDLLILEAFPRQALIYSHAVKAPVIQISSFGMMIDSNYIIGAPSHPLLYPSGLSQRLYNCTMWEKIGELYKHWWVDNMFDKYEEVDNAMFRRVFGENAPTIDELRRNVDLLMLNTHPLWSDNQPWPPNVVSIWGIYKPPRKELPQELQSYLDSSKNGVIYFSLGSNALSSALSPEKIKIFIDTFSKLPYDVLWKWEKDDLPGKPYNVKISKWLPQSDLLKHPNVKLFITQGGLQSTDETINAEVPVIGIPMLGDQWYNVEKFVFHKIGIGLDFQTLNEEKLLSAIEKVINDPSFKQNIARLRVLMNDHPESALDRAVWWTEYVLRHGGAKHLRSPAANMPWTTYYEIKLVISLLSIIVCGFLLTLYVFNKILFK